MFVDRVKIKLQAGNGGNGVVAWRREKYLPKGGPCGGNGGRGASIIIQTDNNVSSLDWYHHRRIINADNGQQGASNQRRGRSGQTLYLKVPCGTLLKDAETGETLFDFTELGQELTICQGGKGGLGNTFFKSPTNRAPTQCTPGKPGEETEIELELKLIADVGLVGFPNAGKSTLINALTAIRVKIGAYPFTTLTPKLGFIKYADQKRTLVADIPGIIEGASENRGLGFEFLRHIERTKLLIFVLDASGIDGRCPKDDLRILREELLAYNPELMKRPYLTVLNKVDCPEVEEHIKDFIVEYSDEAEKVIEVSALEREGLELLKERIRELIDMPEEVEVICETSDSISTFL
jgi:GTP-binding protein